jgi:DNA-binding transcriptional LysR family regulator
MNLHYLELFYYVARHGGITAAARHMPYAIQQPAISSQVSQLEREIGCRLFQRRPFTLTAQGQLLFDFLEPFFSRLPEIEAELRGEASHHLKLAAATPLLRDHLPSLLRQLRQLLPGLRLSLRELRPTDVEQALHRGEVDLAVTAIHQPPPPRFISRPLIDLPLVLLCPQDSPPPPSFDHLVETSAMDGSIDLPLVAIAPADTLSLVFHEELARRGLRWPSQVEVPSLDLVARYVSYGFGYGLSISAPKSDLSSGHSILPLDGFPALQLVLLHRHDLPPLAAQFAEVIARRASSLTSPIPTPPP